MDPRVWGPHAWFFLHSVTLAYPKEPTEQDKIKYRNFFHIVAEVLPCDQCRQHFIKALHTTPLSDKVMSTRSHLVRWLIDFHNEVNVRIGKQKEEATVMLKRYTDAYQNKDTSQLVKEGGQQDNARPNSIKKVVSTCLVLLLGIAIGFLLKHLNMSQQLL